jgi:galactokinase
MINEDVFRQGLSKFREHYGLEPQTAAYAPGRVEVLGNHTDYNEGFVLSAAIDYGTFFLAAEIEGEVCRVVAGDLMEEATFSLQKPKPSSNATWINYVMGVAVGLEQGNEAADRSVKSFAALFLGNVPLGSGLSSSAALEMSSALALCDLYKLSLSELELAKIGQRAEHEFAGVRTGLLDQISSLNGKMDSLVLSDFRSLEVENVPLGKDACFLVCNTRVKHALVDSAYNDRRSSCEQATAFFGQRLNHPVRALRDVSSEELRSLSSEMDPIAALRAAHVIGENARVLMGRDVLQAGQLEEFGQLMFQSHDSSRHNFENSCRELDFLVDEAHKIDAVKGARLSGGGFGGSIVALISPQDADKSARELRKAYESEFGTPCESMVIRPSDRAEVISF